MLNIIALGDSVRKISEAELTPLTLQLNLLPLRTPALLAPSFQSDGLELDHDLFPRLRSEGQLPRPCGLYFFSIASHDLTRFQAFAFIF